MTTTAVHRTHTHPNSITGITTNEGPSLAATCSNASMTERGIKDSTPSLEAILYLVLPVCLLPPPSTLPPAPSSSRTSELHIKSFGNPSSTHPPTSPSHNVLLTWTPTNFLSKISVYNALRLRVMMKAFLSSSFRCGRERLDH